MRLLVSTFDALLRVTLRSDFTLIAVDVVDDRHGIYFGLSRSGKLLYSVARNIGSSGTQRAMGTGTNLVQVRDLKTLEVVQHISHPGFKDLHQIRLREAFLYVLSPGGDLFLVDRQTGKIARGVQLNEYVPLHLRHGAPEEHPSDHYHFNSLTFRKDRMLVLAHNWDFGSFVLEFQMHDGLLATMPEFHLAEIHEGLGFQCHDVLKTDDGIVVLNSRENCLVTSEETVRMTLIGSAQFPRGLAATPAHLFVTSGERGDRGERTLSSTQLHILARPEGTLVASHDLGIYGNPCDVTFADGDIDLTDYCF